MPDDRTQTVHRRLARSCLALFALSSAFPVVAGLAAFERPPTLLGIADVGVAAILALVTMVLVVRMTPRIDDRHRAGAFRHLGRLLAVVPLLLATYVVAGERVHMEVLVVGLAWRGWLLAYALPAISAALERPGHR